MTKTKTLAEHLEDMPDKLTHDEAIDAFKDAAKEVIKERSNVTNSEIKDAMKVAFKELLDERAREFGYFSIKWITTLVIGGLITFFGLKYGFKAPIP